MRNYGDFTPGKAVRCYFNTRDADGDPVTLAGSPAVSAYKDGSTTQDTDGITLTVDFDGLTGLHVVAVDTSADGTFYSAGSEFHLVLTAGTADGKSVVGVVIGSFSLSARSALRPTTADRTLDVSSAGNAGIDWGNVENQSTSVTLDGTATGAVLFNVGGVAGDVGGKVLGGGSGTITGTGVRAVDGSGNAIAPAATALSTAQWTNGRAAALDNLDAAISGRSTLTAAQVNAEVDTAIADARLDELLAADSDIDGASPPAVGSVFHELLSKTAGSFTFDQATDSLEAIRDRGDAAWTTGGGGGGAGAADVWDYLTSNATTAGSLGKLLVDTLDAAVSTRATPSQVNAEADQALADVGLTTTVTGRIDAAISTRLATAGYTSPPSAGSIADAVWDEAQSGHATAGTFGLYLDAAISGRSTHSAADVWAAGARTLTAFAFQPTVGGYASGQDPATLLDARLDAVDAALTTIDNLLDTEVAAIKAKTDNLPADPADASDVATAFGTVNAALAALAGYVDTEVALILTRLGSPAGASLAADVAAVKAETAAILDDTGTGGVVVAAGSKAGYELAATGLDAVAVEIGLNARQSLSIIAAAVAGQSSGVSSGSPVFRAAGVPGTTRIAATAADGNRSSVTLSPPA